MVIGSRIRLEANVAHMMCIHEFIWENLKVGVHLDDLGISVRIIIKCIFKKQDGKMWLGIGMSSESM
jgi:hypothetical protein